MEFHEVFLQSWLEELVGAMTQHARPKSGGPVRLRQPYVWCVLLLHLLCPSVSLPALWHEKRANGATVGDAGTRDPKRRPPGGGCGAGSAGAGPSAGYWPAGRCAGCCWRRP